MAAIATVSGVPYTRVLRDLFPTRVYKDGRLQIAITSGGISRALKRYGVRSYIDRPRRVPKQAAILFFDWVAKEDGVRGYHAVIKTVAGNFLDPNWNDPCEPDFYVKRWKTSGRETLILEVP